MTHPWVPARSGSPLGRRPEMAALLAVRGERLALAGFDVACWDALSLHIAIDVDRTERPLGTFAEGE
jgi:hypothetical protein